MNNNQNNKKSNAFTQSQISEMMSDLELSITRLMEIKEDQSQELVTLRDHFIEVYQKIGVTLLKRQQIYEEKLLKQEQEWRATCDKLIEDHQLMK